MGREPTLCDIACAHEPTRHLLLVPFALLLPSNLTAKAANKDRPITYGCDEVVAIGRVRATAYTDLTIKDDVLGQGRYDMKVTIKRVLRGNETRHVVPVVGYSHGQMREDADFWMVLAPAPGGGYVIRSANLIRIPYKLARTCG